MLHFKRINMLKNIFKHPPRFTYTQPNGVKNTNVMERGISNSGHLTSSLQAKKKKKDGKKQKNRWKIELLLMWFGYLPDFVNIKTILNDGLTYKKQAFSKQYERATVLSALHIT